MEYFPHCHTKTINFLCLCILNFFISQEFWGHPWYRTRRQHSFFIFKLANTTKYRQVTYLKSDNLTIHCALTSRFSDFKSLCIVFNGPFSKKCTVHATCILIWILSLSSNWFVLKTCISVPYWQSSVTRQQFLVSF